MMKSTIVKTSHDLSMHPREFDRIRRMAYEFCGVNLHGKQLLVSSRLGKKLRERKLDSFADYCDEVEQDHSGTLFTEMIDALTTNHTSFFREARHFEFLQNTVLGQLPKDGPICIWSAACSSGEEPYSIALSLIESLGAQAYSRLQITATDVSTRVLAKATRGLYPSVALSSLSLGMRRECLLKGVGEYTDQCLIKPAVRKLIKFSQMNLLQDSSAIGPFHVIFCRNVMIYFDQQTQQHVLNHLMSRLVPGGYLFIGHAESLNETKHNLEFISSATYRKPGRNAHGEIKHLAGARASAR